MTSDDPPAASPTWRTRLHRVIESPWFQRVIVAAILGNAVSLGLETSPSIVAATGAWLMLVDRFFLSIFVVEIVAKLLVHRHRFFIDGWNVFDFIIVGIALVPATNGLSVLRALRVLRVLRLLSVVPRLRTVVMSLLKALPSMGWIMCVLGLIYYVSGVLATNLFGPGFPNWFGTIGASMYTLFQIMTLESWSMGIVRPVMEVYPYAWLFFVPYIIITTFAVLNLFIAIIVNSMQSLHEAESQQHQETVESAARDERRAIVDEVAGLRRDLAALKALLEERPNGGGP